MLIDNFTYFISQLDKCIRAATCKVCVQPHSFVSADSCCGSFGEVKTLFCLETKAYLDEGVFVALQTFRLNLGRKRQKIPPSLSPLPPPPPPSQIKDVKCNPLRFSYKVSDEFKPLWDETAFPDLTILFRLIGELCWLHVYSRFFFYP